MVHDNGTSGDGKAKTSSADLSGMGFIHAVKALKDPSQFTFRDSDPVIHNTVERMSFTVSYHNANMSVIFCVAHCIICNIEKHLIKNMSHALDLLRISGQLQGDIFLFCRMLQIAFHILCQFVKIHFFKRHLAVALIQSGKLNDICHKIG